MSEWDGTPWAGTAMTLTGPQQTRLARERAMRQAYAQRLQTRAIDSYTSLPGLEAQLLAVQGLSNRPWRAASIREALGTPPIFRSVALISSTTGSLGVEAWRKGVMLPDEATPRLVKRPDPFRIPRDFYRDTAYDFATRGEFWWWIAARDPDDAALSLIRVPPWEVTVEPNQRDRLRPKVKWGDREIPLRDLRHGTFLPDDGSPSGPFQRGVGPLQLCGAAMSVAVESQEWAANFYASGNPSYLIKAATPLSEDPETAKHEADTLRDAVMGRDPNTPMVIDPGIDEVKDFPVNAQGSQMLDARETNRADAANMFGIPGALLEYGRPGAALTYQNIAEVFTTFVKTCLAPLYLEPIEQHLSDLLSRSTAARFNVEGFLRSDIKTRFEVYKLGIEAGVMTVDEARREEGLDPGDVEFAPIPFAAPAAFPSSLPVDTRSLPTVVSAPSEVRCDGKRLLRGVLTKCNKKLAEASPFVGRCPRCGKEHTSAA